MSSYQAYFNDELVDYDHPAEAIATAMQEVPIVAG
jgi:hypothetical protein